MNEIVSILIRTLELYQIVILISIVLSWLDKYGQWGLTKMVKQLTEPLLSRLRVIIPVGGIYFDLAPIIALFLLQMIQGIILRLFYVY